MIWDPQEPRGEHGELLLVQRICWPSRSRPCCRQSVSSAFAFWSNQRQRVSRQQAIWHLGDFAMVRVFYFAAPFFFTFWSEDMPSLQYHLIVAEACILTSKVLAMFRGITMASWRIFRIQLPAVSTKSMLMEKTPGWCLPTSLKTSWTGTMSLSASTLWQMFATRAMSASTINTACTGNHPKTLQMETCTTSVIPFASMLRSLVICFQFLLGNSLDPRGASPSAWKMWPSWEIQEQERPWQQGSIAWMVGLVVLATSNTFLKMSTFQALIREFLGLGCRNWIFVHTSLSRLRTL